MDNCQRCGNKTSDRADRYCRVCLDIVRAEMEEAGYLTPLERRGTFNDDRGRPAKNCKADAGSSDMSSHDDD